jgi:hypothetical protein
MSSIGHLASTLLHAALPINLFPANNATSTTAATSATTTRQPDSGQLSSFGQLLSELQQLQQSNPTQYTQVTQKIGSSLETSAQNELASGNSSGASQLNRLATDFTNASATGQLPNFQDLAHAIGDRNGHHQGSGAASLIQSALTTAGIAPPNL